MTRQPKPPAVAAFSGGKDSTAMVLRLAELGEDFRMLFTPTGDELPELAAHISRVVELTRRPMDIVQGPTLYSLIEGFNALPNHRQRWCTRMIKIQPCLAYLKSQPGTTLLVGLRADEEERRGIYSAEAHSRFPMQEWGWKLADVRNYLKVADVAVPRRTDCAMCYAQRLGEWYRLWRDHRDRWDKAEAFEARTGHTFRSPSRDTWPAALRDMRAMFEQGKKPRGVDQLSLVDGPCRVCSL